MTLTDWLSSLDEASPTSVRCTGPRAGAATVDHGEPITACICSAVEGGGEAPAALVSGPLGLTGALSVTAIRVLFVASAGAAAHLGSPWPVTLAVGLIVWWESSKVLRHPAFRPARAFLLSTLVLSLLLFGPGGGTLPMRWDWSVLPALVGLGAVGVGLTSLALAARGGWAGAVRVLPAWAAASSVATWWRPGLVLPLAASAIATQALVAAGRANVGPVPHARFGLRPQPFLARPRRRAARGAMALLMPLAHHAAHLATDVGNQMLRTAWQALRGGVWLANRVSWAVETLARKSCVFVDEACATVVRSGGVIRDGARVFFVRLVPGAVAGGTLGWCCQWTSRQVHAYLVGSPEGSFLPVCAGAALVTVATATAIGVVGRLSPHLVGRGFKDLWELDLTQYLLALWVTALLLSVGVPSLAQGRLVLPSPHHAPFLWLMTLGVLFATFAYWRQEGGAPADPATDRRPWPLPTSEPKGWPAWPGALAAVVLAALLCAPGLLWIMRFS